ncbi:MAG: hypothetical protein JWN04_2054 [Myxococcaceae bacterium]|nr:hypothetical protein [Myxococcaceae bacterium]
MDSADTLVQRIVTGELAAWPLLQVQIEPTLSAFARSHAALRKRGLAGSEDHVAEVVVRTLASLAHDDFKNLRSFAARARGGEGQRSNNFDGWLYGALEFVVLQYLRDLYGRAPKVEARKDGTPSRRDLHSLAGRIDDQQTDPRSMLNTLQMTAKITAAQIHAFAAAHFDSEELRAFQLFYGDEHSFEELARALGLATPADADKLIRRLNARLRYHFQADSAPASDSQGQD